MSALVPGVKRSQRELFMETLICNVDRDTKLLMADVIPNSLAFKPGKPAAGYGTSSHVGYVVHGQQDVKVTHKADALDAEAEAPPLTQERRCPSRTSLLRPATHPSLPNLFALL